MMKYSKATNYALHTMVFLTLNPKGKSMSVEALAEMQKIITNLSFQNIN